MWVTCQVPVRKSFVGGVHFWWVSVVRDFGGPIVMDVILVVGFIRCTDVLDGVGGGWWWFG